MNFNKFRKLTAFSIAFTLVIPLWGCGSDSTSDLSVVDNETVLSNEESIVGVDEVKKYPITDNGIPIWDFDEYVNGEWLKEFEGSEQTYATKYDDAYEIERSRLYDILNDSSLTDLPTDDPLYKTKYIYDQFYEENVNDSLNESLVCFLQPVYDVETLEDLFDLYKNKDYSYFCNELVFNITGGDWGDIDAVYSPVINDNLLNEYNNFVANPTDGSMTEIYANVEKLGIDQTEYIKMLSNLVVISQYLREYQNSYANGYKYQYFYKETFEQNNIDVPVFDIIEEFTEKEYNGPIVATENLFDFFDVLFCEDNLDALKDSLILNIIYDISFINSDWDRYEDEEYDNAFYFTISVSRDVLALEYQSRYFDEEKLKEIRQFVFAIKTQAQSVVREFDWLSEKSMETAVRKIVLMKPSYGVSDHVYYLSDVVLSDDLFENFINIIKSRRKFSYSQLYYFDEERGTFFQNKFDVNAYYNASLNNITLTTGLLTELLETDMTYEEKIAELGMTVAHEISHSFGPSCIYFEGDGYYDQWMTDEEINEYDDRIRRIIQFFDGKETEYFDPINGAYYADETYADLMAMEICLRILEEQDNVDYDLFFKTFASRKATYYTEESAALLNGDNHLPAKFRINYILGQFPKFYEVYKIDEESPFYVPNLERLTIFK